MAGHGGHPRLGIVRNVVGRDLRQSEIQDVWLALGVDADIGRFEIAVDDAVQVRRVDRFAYLAEQPQRVVDGMIAFGQVGIERLTGDVVHDEVEVAGRGAAVVDGDDVGMVELAEDLHLALEAGLVARAGERPFAHDLDRDRAPGRFLDRLVDHALAAAVDLREDAVAGDCDGGRGRRVRHLRPALHLRDERSQEGVVLASLCDRGPTRCAPGHVPLNGGIDRFTARHGLEPVIGRTRLGGWSGHRLLILGAARQAGAARPTQSSSAYTAFSRVTISRRRLVTRFLTR